ncbi:MAG: hypothetical protein SFU99_03900 [Saprospiraceae bacterium]|nr:hypothetical protein [Saprospiraceae bacterium]
MAENEKQLEIVTNQLAAISNQLAALFDPSKQKITEGTTRIPYLELTYVIPAGARQEVFQVFNYFRVMSMSGGALSVLFGQNGIESPFTAAGVGIRFEESFMRMTLINTGGTTMTIRIALALGNVQDDRLNVSGVVTVDGTVDIYGGATLANSQASVTTTASNVSAASATKRSVIIKNLSTSAATVYIGTSAVTSANGFELKAGEALTLDVASDVYARTASGTGTISVAEIFN